ncbi:GNAT family N-acetyltransferase [Halopelagius longus]|uniref:GNAT family N-acetyltransferase n=1 Tax=Halopelagius longus TaxID=1236180 RepID=A0A1H1AJG3_9EURY|nr:GNAT family N-acetyltransferase [Halopelagius longus]RDI70394.1 GNAT family N-acetyltransferase [Halopelagius longus]SDQ39641.1 N-acetylglutamate synthase, GNAT family [Halopelagius longus]
MYVRDAKNRDEVWLLDRIEEMGLTDPAFRSRDYVIALDEETTERAGFGRIRVHRDGDDEDGAEFCELALVATLERWRRQGVGAHVVERLLTKAGDEGFDDVYGFTAQPEYVLQFGFSPVDGEQLPPTLEDRLDAVREERGDDAIAVRIAVEEFEMPPRLRERFKEATPGDDDGEVTVEETAEDFGIDPDEVTYKYDTG